MEGDYSRAYRMMRGVYLGFPDLVVIVVMQLVLFPVNTRLKTKAWCGINTGSNGPKQEEGDDQEEILQE